MVDLIKLNRSISTQTGDGSELFINLSKSKHAWLKYSTSYKDTVLSFNINSSKSFILTKAMWKILKPNLEKIDYELSK